MLISEDKADELLGSDKNLINILNRRQGERNPNSIHQENVEIRPIHNGGRRPGDCNLTQEQRNAVGILAQFTPNQILSEMTGISPSQISALKTGSHSTATYHEKTETKQVIDEQLTKIKDRALLKIMQSMDLLSDEKMQKASIKDVSSVMSSLTRVAGLAKDAEQSGAVKAAKIIVYSPRLQVLNNFGPPLEVESV